VDAVRRDVHVGGLGQGVDPGVGAGSALEAHEGTGQPGQRLFHTALDAAPEALGLELPAGKVGALVGQDQFQAHGLVHGQGLYTGPRQEGRPRHNVKGLPGSRLRVPERP